MNKMYTSSPLGAVAYCWELSAELIERTGLFGQKLYYGPGWLVTGVGTHRHRRGRGLADQVMRQIVFDADRSCAVLYLEVEPDPDTDYDRLDGWYKRLGFEPFTDDDSNARVRVPKGWKPGK